LRPINPFTGFVDAVQDPVGTTTTDTDGNYTPPFDGISGLGLLETSGGQFVDVSDGDFHGGARRSEVLSGDQGFKVCVPTGIPI
jgi:hypothetical protein